jgi:pimeloyl-ACP methyl ester carboxylesterase
LLIDPRGTGSSDPLDVVPTPNEQAADVVAVLDDAGIEAAFVHGFHAGVGTAIALAVDAPERVSALVLVNGWARIIADEDCPWGLRGRAGRWPSTGRRVGSGLIPSATQQTTTRWRTAHHARTRTRSGRCRLGSDRTADPAGSRPSSVGLSSAPGHRPAVLLGDPDPARHGLFVGECRADLGTAGLGHNSAITAR